MRPHQLQDERSLAIHRLVAERIREDPRLLEAPRKRVAEWILRGHMNPKYPRAWAALLDGPIDKLMSVLNDPGERATALRHASPFAGVIDFRTRERVWREIKERLEAEQRARSATPR